MVDQDCPNQPQDGEHVSATPLPPPLPRSFHEELRNQLPTTPPISPEEEGGSRAADQTAQSDQGEQTFKPFYIFFYGSLMDPEVLQTVLRLPQPPVLQTGWITGFMMKMWGIYPTLIPLATADDETKVSGVVWKINDESHMSRLVRYETSAYIPRYCTIYLDNGVVLPQSRVFAWAGDGESKELQEGSFDLERYQKYFKRSIVRRAG